MGHSHAKEKARVVAKDRRYQLVGFYEPDAAAQKGFAADSRFWVSQEELLEKSEVIAVESTVKDLSRLAKLALDAGKHVHLEKPGSANAAEFEALLELARRKGKLLQLGYMWRYNPGFSKVLEIARAGWLGEIFSIRATMNTLVEAANRAEWGRFAGGALFEQGCHLIDPVVRLLGKPASVTSFLKTHGSDQADLADNTVAVLEYPKAMATIFNSTLQPNAGPHRFFEVIGSNGLARLNPIEQPVVTIDLAKPAGPYPAGSQVLNFPTFRRYEGDFAELAEAVREGKPLAVTPEQELAVHQTLLKACRMT